MTKNSYDAEAIEVLSGLDPVRKRPGMYTDTSNPNHLIQEVLDNSVDEALSGHCSNIKITLLKDGSIKDRTTRGNRSLWYHHTGLGEAFMILEIANAANVKLPKNYEKNLLKAAELFQDGFMDNSILEPWAKKAHNSQPSNGIQKFNKNLNSITIDSQWFHIIQYRYPNHRTSKFLKTKLTTKAKSLKSSGAIAIGIGCIYNALANFN